MLVSLSQQPDAFLLKSLLTASPTKRIKKEQLKFAPPGKFTNQILQMILKILETLKRLTKGQ